MRLRTSIAVAGLFAVFGTSALLAPLTQAAPTPAPAPAVSNFGSCLAAHKSGDVELLIDESGSLSHTDPTAARVTAAKYFVNELAQFGSDDHISFAVSVAGFSYNYVQRLGWTSLTSRSLGRVGSALDAMRSRDTGYETDYWTALDGSRQSFEEQAKTKPGVCQAVVWFTDGQLALSTRHGDQGAKYGLTKPYSGSLKLTSAAAARAAARDSEQDICRPGGLADALRSDRVTTFALGLQQRNNPQNFSLLTRIATGTDVNGTKCGAITSPAPGSFQPVSDIDNLLLAFDALGSAGQPQIDSTSGVCQRKMCAEDAHTFVLDRSIRAVHILATSGAVSAHVVLTLPSGNHVVLDNPGAGRLRSLTASGVSFRYMWESDKSIVIDLGEGPSTSGWSGEWALTFVDPSGTSARAVSRSNIHISSDIFPVVAARSTSVLRSNSKSTITFGLVDANRNRVDPASLLGNVSLSAVLVDDHGKTISTVATNLTKSRLATAEPLSLTGVSPGTVTLRLSLAITTAPATRRNGVKVAGTTLSPQVSEQILTIAAPLNYPIVRGSIDFGSITGAAHRTAELAVTGPGCVWVDPGTPATITVQPSGLGSTTVHGVDATSATHCLRLTPGQKQFLHLQLTTQHQGAGTLKGEVPVSLRPAQSDGAPLTVEVPFTAALHHSFKTTAAVSAIVLAIVLGIAIPLIILYLGKWSEAKFPPGTRYVERFPITVRDGRVLRDGTSLALRDTDFVGQSVIVAKGGSRSVSLAGLPAQARISWAPGSPAYGSVDTKNLLVATGNRGAAARQDDAKLALALRSSWILLHDPVGAEDSATLVLIVGAHTPREDRAALLADAAERVPDVLARIRAAGVVATNRPPEGPGDPFGGGAPAPAGPVDDPFGGPSSQPSPTGAPSNDPFSTSGRSRPAAMRNTPPQSAGPADDDPFGAPGRSSSASDDPFA